MENTKYLIDLRNQANSLYGYLMLDFIPKNHIKDHKQFAVDLERLLFDLVIITIRSSRNRLVPDSTKEINVCKPIHLIADKYNLNKSILSVTIMDCNVVIFLLETIDNYTKINPYEIWVLENKFNTYILESLGDFRIIEWELKNA